MPPPLRRREGRDDPADQQDPERDEEERQHEPERQGVIRTAK